MLDVIRRLAALSAALLLALTACGGDDSDSVAESRPEYANQTGEAGAEKFAGYWVDQINKATSTGETKGLKSLGLDGCAVCSDFPKQVDTIYNAGGRVESDDWTIKTVVPEHGATDERVGMLITVTVPPNTVYADADAKPQKFPGGDQRFRMIVVRQGEHWMIKQLTPR
jgi:uncharacterized protein DUF6318